MQSSEQVITNDNNTPQISEPWIPDNARSPFCHSCKTQFTTLNRRHHCRLCGNIFCNNCTKYRALIPPSSIVLTPELLQISTFNSNSSEPDREVSYTSNNQILYGRGLEERTKLARLPLRVCESCVQELKPMQEELRLCNSNAMRYNTIDPSHWRRLFNSPLAFTLGHEVRKAAYTLNNLLPLPKKMGIFQDFTADFEHQQQNCQFDASGCLATPNLNTVDGVRIPTKLLNKAQGIAIITTMKCGMGLGVEFGTGLVIARLDHSWSAPCAIGTLGLSWGALVGAQVSDTVLLLMTRASVELFTHDDSSFQLGADIGVSVGPIGRNIEADVGLSSQTISPIYTYSLSKGLYAGLSFDGKLLFSRKEVNRNFYGMGIPSRKILDGDIPSPPAAQPLYDALKRCEFYANSDARKNRVHETVLPRNVLMSSYDNDDAEYGEI